MAAGAALLCTAPVYWVRCRRAACARLVRRCWCGQCKLTCPVHVVGEYFRSLPEGAQPFAAINKAKALVDLRAMLKAIGVAEAEHFRTHDVRRGHAEDLLESGAPLVEILRAGEWRSAAFANYIDDDKLEAGAVLDAHWIASDDEDA